MASAAATPARTASAAATRRHIAGWDVVSGRDPSSRQDQGVASYSREAAVSFGRKGISSARGLRRGPASPTRRHVGRESSPRAVDRATATAGRCLRRRRREQGFAGQRGHRERGREFAARRSSAAVSCVVVVQELVDQRVRQAPPGPRAHEGGTARDGRGTDLRGHRGPKAHFRVRIEKSINAIFTTDPAGGAPFRRGSAWRRLGRS